MRGLIALWLASAASIATPALAQVATNIVPDAGNAFDVGTLVSQVGNVTTIDGGTIADSGLAKNIFHSFSLFDLGNGDVARWVTTETDPGLVANVISRVTGGATSFIEGTIDSTALPNASFFFINPSGIVFGNGAVVDVPGISAFSTASSVDFFGSETFSATTADGSTFSVANPQAFGFLGQQANILVSGATDLAAPGDGERRLSFYAANVGVSDSSATSTEVDIIAVGQAIQTLSLNAQPTLAQASGEIFITRSTFNTVSAGQTSGLALLGGLVTIDSSIVSAEASEGAAGGFLGVQADTLTISNSIVSTSTDTEQSAGGVVIRANDARITADSSLSSDTSGAGNAGLVLVLAHSLAIEQSSIKSDALPGSTGFGGNVIVGADLLTIADGFISADSFGEGDAGNVFVTHNDETALLSDTFENTVQLSGTSFISSDANDGSLGNAGNVTVNAGVLQLFDNASISSDARAGAAGNAGTVSVTADTIEIFSARNDGRRAAIRSETSGDGFAGSVTVDAGQITIGAGNISSSARTGSTGNAGFVEVNATRFIDIFDNGSISSDTSGAGFGGDVTVSTGDLALDENSFITSDANEGSTGSAGAVEVNADSIRLSNFAFISSDARPQSQGNAGFVNVKAGSLLLESDGSIRSNTSAFGRAGDVIVTADSLIARDGGNISTTAREDSLGDAGFVRVNATDLKLEDGGFISSDAEAFTFGNAGSVSINAKTLALSGNAAIRSNTASFGFGGSVDVMAETVAVSSSANISSNATFGSSGNAGFVTINASKSLALDQFGAIASDTFGSGRAGDVVVTTPSLSVRNNAFISSDANPGSTGDAGFLSISGADILIADGGFISSDASGDGLGGNVTLLGGTLRVMSNGRVSAQANSGSTGDAGFVSIAMDSVTVDNGRIASTSQPGASGFSGQIDIDTGNLVLRNGGSIETSSANANIAGLVSITADAVTITGTGSRISSENSFVRTGQSGQAVGDAGNAAAGDIFLTANSASLLQGGAITTNSMSGPAGSIFVTLPQGSLLLLESTTTPSLITTSSGPGTGGVISIASPLAIVSNGGSILAKGQQGGADVAIRSSFFIRSADRDNRVSVDGSFFIDSSVTDVSSGTAAPATDFLDASRVLSGQCASARASGETSVLSARKIGPYALPGASSDLGAGHNGGCL